MQYRLHKVSVFMGTKNTMVHYEYRFEKSPWLVKLVDHNTEKRTKPKTNFGKDLNNLLNNALLGKRKEILREQIRNSFLNKANKKTTIQMSFKGMLYHCFTFSLHNYDNENCVFDKPVCSRFSVLELGELLLYEVHCHTLQPLWNEICNYILWILLLFF